MSRLSIVGNRPDIILYLTSDIFKVKIISFPVASLVSRGGFNEISRDATEWLVKPAPTAQKLYTTVASGHHITFAIRYIFLKS